jgi:hypothetical protein
MSSSGISKPRADEDGVNHFEIIKGDAPLFNRER